MKVIKKMSIIACLLVICNLFVSSAFAPINYSIKLAPQWILRASPVVLIVDVGRSFTIDCQMSGSKPLTLLIKRNDVLLKASSRCSYSISKDGVCELTITDADTSDTAIYTFIALNEYGRSETSASVSVIKPPEMW